jgi:beta-N-acetylhexosaminidase
MNGHSAHVDSNSGIRCIVEPSGIELTALEREQLRELQPAGIMLRKRNFLQGRPYNEWLSAYAVLLADCRAAIGRPSIIVSIDHEGGAVHRFPSPITRFPYAATYGAVPEAVFQVASAMGEELAALGVNLSFSPVADIHSNPRNPVINERAYGTSVSQVSSAALACARALRQQGIVPCAKHFPGHGDTADDSHYAVPSVLHSRSELEQRELLPFRTLIDDGIEMIMSAHLMVPAIDPDNQATISRPILTDLLRGALGFRGLTVADALGMKGIHSIVTGGSFPVLAHRAGLDLFLVVGDTVSIGDALKLRDQLARALREGELDTASVLETEHRIVQFLATLPQHAVREIPAETLARHAALAQTFAAHAPWSSFAFNPVGFD